MGLGLNSLDADFSELAGCLTGMIECGPRFFECHAFENLAALIYTVLALGISGNSPSVTRYPIACTFLIRVMGLTLPFDSILLCLALSVSHFLHFRTS